ncbi:hypothetical protein [Nocardiopsis lucentensis]|uniref:hypothetical protein n=1 Tax=Nocardiopsis lucentensis TaxID=53441 RepID=UPI00034B85CE|nr:hypothetical protein [Nocardiopsis lucentensis]
MSEPPNDDWNEDREQGEAPDTSPADGDASSGHGADTHGGDGRRPGPAPVPQAPLPSAVTNLFYGTVHAPDSTFGASGGSGGGHARPPVTGPLTDEVIRAAVDGFVRPEPFDEAARILAGSRVLVLTSGRGTGKRTGAIALVREKAAGPIVELPPSRTLADLSGHDFKPGYGYIVPDWFGVRRADPEAEHEYMWSVLRSRVEGAKSWLVLTTDRRTPVGTAAPALDWARPTPVDVLGERLGADHPREKLDQAVARLTGDCPVADLVAVADRMAGGQDPEAAVEHVLRSSSRGRVQGWFEQRPERRDVADVTALSLLHGVTERDFERLAARLHERLTEAFPPPPERPSCPGPGWAAQDGEEDEERERRKERDSLPARRGRRGDGRHSLVRVELRDDGWLARRHPTFVEEGVRSEALRQLWEHYDVDFWNAVRGWVVAAVGHGRFQVALASGLAAFAATAFDEVHDVYLDPWSRRTGPTRDTCLYVLWFMCMDDDLAPVALRTVDRWLASGRPAQIETGIRAWGGELGVRYPTEGVNRLWAQLVDTEGVRREQAALAFGNLFGSLVDRDGNARDLIRGLSLELSSTHRFGRDRPKYELLLVAAFATLVIPTSEPLDRGSAVEEEQRERGDGDDRGDRDGDEDRTGGSDGAARAEVSDDEERLPDTVPAVARHLVRSRDQIPQVASLWAAVIRHQPVRRPAIESLWRTLCALQRSGPDAQWVGESLLTSLSQVLPSTEHEAFRATFTGLAKRGGDPDTFTSAVLNLLSQVFGRAKNTASGTGDQPMPASHRK